MLSFGEFAMFPVGGEDNVVAVWVVGTEGSEVGL